MSVGIFICSPPPLKKKNHHHQQQQQQQQQLRSDYTPLIALLDDNRAAWSKLIYIAISDLPPPPSNHNHCMTIIPIKFCLPVLKV